MPAGRSLSSGDGDGAHHPSRLPRPCEPAGASRAGRAAAGDQCGAGGGGIRRTCSGSRRRWPRTRSSCASTRPRTSRRWRRGCRTQGFAALDADTFLGPATLAAARRAAGAVVRGVDMVMAGEARNAFCAVRPPGHHAETATADGLLLLRQRRDRAHGTRSRCMGSSGSRSSTSTCTMATAPRIWSGTMPASCSPRPTRCRSTPAPAQAERTRRARADRQRAAAAGCRRRAPSAPALLGRVLPAVEAHAPGDDPGLGRLRRPRPRPAGEPRLDRGGFRLGDGAALRPRRQALRRPDRLDSGGRI